MHPSLSSPWPQDPASGRHAPRLRHFHSQPPGAAANTKLPLSRVASLERSRDPVFHLIPNAIKLYLDQGEVLQFAAFQHRDEAHALLTRCLPSAARQDSAGRATAR